MPPNVMKQKLLNGEPAFGVSIMIPSPQLVEMVGKLGFDWVLIDFENGTINPETVVNAVKYHPIGTRGLAAGTRPANYGFGISQSEYVEMANRESLICVQFEDKEALDHVDEILDVDHIDVFFVGPSDLSQSMGHPGQYDEPSVAAAIDSTFKKPLAAGNVAGTPANADKVRATLDRGVLYMYTHVTKLLGAAVDGYFEAAGRQS